MTWVQWAGMVWIGLITGSWAWSILALARARRRLQSEHDRELALFRETQAQCEQAARVMCATAGGVDVMSLLDELALLRLQVQSLEVQLENIRRKK